MKKVKIKIHAKNKGTQPIGIGAGDFYLKIDGKKYTLASGNNFGQEIAKGKEITGYGYYTVPPKIKEAELVYIPQEKELEVWKLGDFND
ncbi:DUF4352 domain-containing protein [Listeria rocourtiae]|uniref:DUF4352 domain-containing protein n=1 Tax=Listeria rocourtiae TaxID=647910 RepID=UPI00098D568D